MVTVDTNTTKQPTENQKVGKDNNKRAPESCFKNVNHEMFSYYIPCKKKLIKYICVYELTMN